MSSLRKLFLPCFFCAVAVSAHADPRMSIQTTGTLVIVPAYSEIKYANDEAYLTFTLEEQDKDKTAALSQANQKMKQGAAIIKREDPNVILKTRGYYTYPVYAEDQPHAPGKLRPVIGWRVTQQLDVTTSNMAALPSTVAAAQQILSLNSVQFGLREDTKQKLDQQRIEAAYRNLTERIAAIARTMGRPLSDAVLETVDFEGSGAYAQSVSVPKVMMRTAAPAAMSAETPSLEPGETTLPMQIIGKVRFK
jgi:uncharacterized protein YggE